MIRNGVLLGAAGISSSYFPGEVVHEEGNWALCKVVRLPKSWRWPKEIIVLHKCVKQYDDEWDWALVDLFCKRCGMIC